MSELLRDFRLGLRTWIKAPPIVLVTVLSLGLGIGVATSIFTLANSLLFAPSSGLEDPDTLVRIYTSDDEGRLYGRSSYPDFESISTAVDGLESSAASLSTAMTLGTGSASRIVVVEKVTRNFFAVLGVRPTLGRPFAVDDVELGSDRIAILSHGLWQRAFDSDPEVVGESVELGAELYEVVGVSPEDFKAGNPMRETDAWVPFELGPRGQELVTRRDMRRLAIVARLRQGTTLGQVSAQLEVVAQRLHRQYGLAFADSRGSARTLTPLAERESRMTPDRQAVIAVLTLFPLIIAGLILILACSNVATLFLARAEQRQRETAIRIALGASRRRLLSMFLVESLIPGLTSGALGLGIAWGASRALSSLTLPMAIPLTLDVGVDGRVVGFALLLSIGTTLTFGLAPALAASKPDLVPSLKSQGGSGRRPGRFGLRRILVVAQVAASMVLIVGSGLFLRSLEGAASLDLGFSPERIALMSRSLPRDQSGEEAARLYVQETLQRLRALPEVEDAQASRAVELTLLSARSTPIEVGSYDLAPGKLPLAYINTVTPGYLEMLEITILQGRSLQESDSEGAPRVAVINDVFAERFWPRGQAIGHTFRAGARVEVGLQAIVGEPAAGAGQTYRVVGIARDGKYRDIDDPPAPYFWTSLYQEPSANLALLVKGYREAEAMVPLLRREIRTAEGEITLVPPTTLAAMVDTQLLPGRLAVAILGWGGAFGLLLAVIGIYGQVSYSVTRRTRELAIRMAIGAEQSRVVRAIAKEGITLAIVGLCIGLMVVLPLARLVRAQLFGTSPADPVALLAGTAVLLTAAIAASIIPARRVTAIDPMKALREE